MEYEMQVNGGAHGLGNLALANIGEDLNRLKNLVHVRLTARANMRTQHNN